MNPLTAQIIVSVVIFIGLISIGIATFWEPKHKKA